MKFLKLALYAWLFLGAITARASDADARFDQANKFFEEGNFKNALAAYDKLLATGVVSEAVWFNRGNALLKLGQTGRAILSYRQAAILAPRDADLRVNLQRARTLARGGSEYREEKWRTLIASLSLNEWTLLMAGFLWLFFGLLALRQYQPPLKQALNTYCVAAAILLGFVSIGFAVAVVQGNSPMAVVVAGEAEVRNGPLDESPSVYKVRDGVELGVLDEKDGWLQVQDSSQRVGWLRRDQAELFVPALPQPKP